MNTKITGFLAAILMLAAPSMHGMAGYHFHFDATKPAWTFKELLQPDRLYTEHMQPEEVRPSREYVDEIFKMKKVMGIKTPIIIKNESLDHHPAGIASASNYLFYSRLRINEKAFTRETERYRTHDNTATLAHELTHIKNKDHHMQHSLLSIKEGLESLPHAAIYTACLTAAYGVVRRSKIFILGTLFAGFISQHYADKLPDLLEDKIGALEPQSDEQALAQTRAYELAAEIGSYKTLAQCGYCEAIKDAYFDLTDIAQAMKNENKTIEEIENFRPNGIVYPTLSESINFMADSLQDCVKNIGTIDPNTTKDTPNLKRNGSPVKQAESQPMSWYETIFGKKS